VEGIQALLVSRYNFTGEKLLEFVKAAIYSRKFCGG
jgi:hypothetical protein